MVASAGAKLHTQINLKGIKNTHRKDWQKNIAKCNSCGPWVLGL